MKKKKFFEARIMKLPGNFMPGTNVTIERGDQGDFELKEEREIIGPIDLIINSYASSKGEVTSHVGTF